MGIREIQVVEIAEILGVPFSGDNRTINGLIKLVHAESEHESLITFCGNEPVLPEVLANSRITAIITKESIYRSHRSLLSGRSVLVSDAPMESFYRLHQYLYDRTDFYREYDFAKETGTNCSIHPSAVIEAGVRIGNNVSIGPFCMLRKGTTIGDDCVIDANVVIGGSGFEIKVVNQIPRSAPHVGGVKIGRNVEIGAGCVIDKAMFERATTIEENTKIDNLVQIGHNCSIGKDVLICAHVQISGSVTIGDRCYLAPSVSIRDQLRIAPGVFVGIGAVVTKHLSEIGTYVGVPARRLETRTPRRQP